MFELTIVLYSLFFYKLNKHIHFKVNTKRARNYVSFIHSLVLSTMLHYNTNHIFTNIILPFSVAYFLHDTVYIFNNCLQREKLYVYHHLVCLYIYYCVYMNRNSELLLRMMFIGECSNFFTYIMYDLIKQQKQNTKVFYYTQILQFLWFSYFRIFKMSCFAYSFLYNIDDIFLQLNLLYHLLVGNRLVCQTISIA